MSTGCWTGDNQEGAYELLAERKKVRNLEWLGFFIEWECSWWDECGKIRGSGLIGC